MTSFDIPGSPIIPGDPEVGMDLEPDLLMTETLTDTKHFLPESVKSIAESTGITGLSDEAARELAEDATFRLRTLLQDTHKFMVHSKRKNMLCEDLDLALRSNGK